MKMGTCSVHIMGGLLMDVDLALGFLRLHLKVLKLVHFSLQEHVLLGFLQWCLKACFLFGLMRMVRKEQVPPSPPCNSLHLILFCLWFIY